MCVCVCGKWITSLNNNNNERFIAESKHYHVRTYNSVNHHHLQHGVIMYGVHTYITYIHNRVYLSYRTYWNIPDCWSRSVVDPRPTTLINPIPLSQTHNQMWVTLHGDWLISRSTIVIDVIFHRRVFRVQYFRGSLLPRMGCMWVYVCGYWTVGCCYDHVSVLRPPCRFPRVQRMALYQSGAHALHRVIDDLVGSLTWDWQHITGKKK